MCDEITGLRLKGYVNNVKPGYIPSTRVQGLVYGQRLHALTVIILMGNNLGRPLKLDWYLVNQDSYLAGNRSLLVQEADATLKDPTVGPKLKRIADLAAKFFASSEVRAYSQKYKKSIASNSGSIRPADVITWLQDKMYEQVLVPAAPDHADAIAQGAFKKFY